MHRMSQSAKSIDLVVSLYIAQVYITIDTTQMLMVENIQAPYIFNTKDKHIATY